MNPLLHTMSAESIAEDLEICTRTARIAVRYTDPPLHAVRRRTINSPSGGMIFHRLADLLVRARTHWPRRGFKGDALLRVVARDARMRGPTPYGVQLGTDAADITRRAREVRAVLTDDERARAAECDIALRKALLRLYWCQLRPEELSRLQSAAILHPGILRHALTGQTVEIPSDFDLFALQFGAANISVTEELA